MTKRDGPIIEITEEMMESGANNMTENGVVEYGREVNPLAFARGMRAALMAAGYEVKVPSLIEQDF